MYRHCAEKFHRHFIFCIKKIVRCTAINKFVAQKKKWRWKKKEFSSDVHKSSVKLSFKRNFYYKLQNSPTFNKRVCVCVCKKYVLLLLLAGGRENYEKLFLHCRNISPLAAGCSAPLSIYIVYRGRLDWAAYTISPFLTPRHTHYSSIFFVCLFVCVEHDEHQANKLSWCRAPGERV